MAEAMEKRLPRATSLAEIMALVVAPTALGSLKTTPERQPIRLPKASSLIVVNDTCATAGALRH